MDVSRNRGYRSRGRGFHNGSFGGKYYENKIKNVIIQHTGSYDGVGERMIGVIKEIVSILSGCKQEEIESVYNKIEELMIEFISTHPYGTGMFAGITTLMSTSLMNECPFLIGSDLTARIVDGSIERFSLELSRSNYYSSQLLLNFLTELTNFYVLSLNQLISIYRSLLNMCLTLKDSKKDHNSKYDISDHNSIILFSMLAYTIPYLRDEHRKMGDNCENKLYGEFIKDMIQFYDSHIYEYCKDVHMHLKKMFNNKFVDIELLENSFEKYWRKFLEWRDHDSPKIGTVIRFYRSTTISDYLSEITSSHKLEFGKLDNLVFGKVSEYLPKLLIKIPYVETMEIGDFLLLHVMDGVVEIFMQYPFEAARQLLKIPVTSSSYDLCLSITIWNSLLNPFYSYNITYVNSLVINLIKLQNSVLNDIWIPIFINKLVNYKDVDCDITENSVSHNDSMTDSKMINENQKSQEHNVVLEEIEHSGKLPLEDVFDVELKDEKEATRETEAKEETKRIFNHKIFPRVESYSSLMLVKLRIHFSTLFSSQELFQSPSQKNNFWRNKNNSLFYKIEEQSSFATGFLDSVLSGMSKIMLPQTLSSIPNEILYERVIKFPSINKSIKSIPDSVHILEELKSLNDILVFKFTNKNEIYEKNDSLIKYLISILDKQSGHVNDQIQDDDDIEMSKRFMERDDSNVERKHKNSSDSSSIDVQNHNTDDTTTNNDISNDIHKDKQSHDQTQMNDFKSQKKRRLNPSILESSRNFTWTRDALMDLLLISIIGVGAKSLTHTRRLFGNYMHSLKEWYSSTINSEVSLSGGVSGKYLDATGHPFFDAVSDLALRVLGKKLFIDSLNYVFSERLDSNENGNVIEVNDAVLNLERYTEVRQLSCILTLWGCFGIQNDNVSTGYNIQKMRIVLMSIVEESVVSPHTVVLYLGCVLLYLKDFVTTINYSRNKYMYQLFMDFFEIILDILTRISVKISIEEKELSRNKNNHDKMDLNADNSIEMNDESNDNNELSQKSFKNVKDKLVFSKTVIILLVIFTSEEKTLIDINNIESEYNDGIYIKLLNSAAYDICLMYGTYIRDLVNSDMIFNGKSLLEGESILPLILQNLRSIYGFSLESLLSASDANKRLDNKWVSKKKDSFKKNCDNTEVKENDDGKGRYNENIEGSNSEIHSENGINF
ncbi:hypothetical protein FG386_001189 [Cryptosporidium ryanae]|uniref:uncharacterized protein n=1 Tax=Cryptosporidium ryanae TaxID=515981 RepID=UPI00351A6641|nr:hypothetical protein FG386_001189 [Cryptosporidium ryanae]